MREELKPCPFCGCAGVVDHGGPHEPDEWCGLCVACDYSLPFKLTQAEAITAWNTRSNPPQEERSDPLDLAAADDNRLLEVRDYLRQIERQSSGDGPPYATRLLKCLVACKGALEIVEGLPS